MPNTHGGLLRRDYVESEKEKLLEKIRGRINDKRSYSMQRLAELMCVMENYSVDKYGTETDVESISSQALTRHYRETLAASPIEIFYSAARSPQGSKWRSRPLLLPFLAAERNRTSEPRFA
jgi:predicted Zn-dependent peptidase